MTRIKLVIIGLSVLLSLGIIGGALFVASTREEPVATQAAPKKTSQRTVSKSELAAANGKDGKTCLVAVDGMVYEIKDFSLWQNGEHTTSGGLAYCGADLSDVIDKAPHGRKMLDILIKVGPLKAN